MKLTYIQKAEHENMSMRMQHNIRYSHTSACSSYCTSGMDIMWCFMVFNEVYYV